MNKKQLSERDMCTKFITPALEQASWDITTQIREELSLTKGRVIVRGKLHTRAKHKRADYVLFYKPNQPIAVIEARVNKHSVGDSMQQALGYADLLQVPFVFSSNGDGFLFHNKIAKDGVIECEMGPHELPNAETLWQWRAEHQGLSSQHLRSYPCPLLPLPEKRRIVNRIDQLSPCVKHWISRSTPLLVNRLNY